MFAVLTVPQARQRGWRITRGDYQSTNDNRLDGWYIERTSADCVNRIGLGFRTRAAALLALSDYLRSYDWRVSA